jgi:Leucine-rich repeat (LRR) protein
MYKPKDIIELENIYSIEIFQLERCLYNSEFWEKRNHYVCNEKNEVIALNIGDNDLEEIVGLEKFFFLEELILRGNKIEEIDGLDNLKSFYLAHAPTNPSKYLLKITTPFIRRSFG